MLLLVDDIFAVVAPLLLLVLVPLFFGASTFVVTPYALVVVVLALALLLFGTGTVAFWHWHCCLLALAPSLLRRCVLALRRHSCAGFMVVVFGFSCCCCC